MSYIIYKKVAKNQNSLQSFSNIHSNKKGSPHGEPFQFIDSYDVLKRYYTYIGGNSCGYYDIRLDNRKQW